VEAKKEEDGRKEGRKEAKPELDLDDDPQNKASLRQILPVCHALQRRFHGTFMYKSGLDHITI
jgi:hypothetical protein